MKTSPQGVPLCAASDSASAVFAGREPRISDGVWRHLWAALLVTLAFLWAVKEARADDDIRTKYGTRSMEAAKVIQEGMQQMNAKHIAEGLKSFEKASAIDPDCTFALYWLANASSDLGDIDRGISILKNLVELGQQQGGDDITVNSAIDLGLTYGRLGDPEKATHYFSQAILIDPRDKVKMAFKAYRNMAIAFTERKQPFSAAICALKAYEANSKMIPQDFVEKMMDGIGNDEVGTPINFAVPGEEPKPRQTPLKLQPLAIAGIDEEIVDLQVDAVQDRVFAFAKDKPYYFVFEGSAPGKAVKVPVEGSILSGCATAGNLYVIRQNPASFAKVDPLSGKAEQSWPLASPAASLAVFPIQGEAVFPVGGVLQKLNLQTGQGTATEHPGTRVRADPRQRFCFSDIHPGFHDETGHMIVDGHPIFFERINSDWRQTSLVRYAIADGELLLSSFRMNAASNGRELHVSPDGRWVAEVGGGGWRPTSAEGKTGYGVAVFRAEDLSHVQGFFFTDAYPQGVAINSVAGLVAVFNEKKLHVYDLAAPDQQVAQDGQFSTASVWDAGGLSLYVAGKSSGLVGFQIDRSPEELQIAKTWVAAMRKEWPVPAQKRAENAIAAVPGFDGFQTSASKEELLALIQKAIRDGRTNKPVSYLNYAPYTSGAIKRADLEQAFKAIQSGETGVTIFKLKKLLEAEPKNPAALLTIGFAYFQTGQLDKALPIQLEAVHLDAGRTDVSVEALRNLAHIYAQQKQPLPAAQSYAALLQLDKANGRFAQEAAPFFQAAGVATEAEPLLKASAGMTAPAEANSPSGLPKFPAPSPAPEMNSVKLFAATVSSVVLVKSSFGSGSGVCVASGIVLTNSHVTDGGSVAVQPFAMVDGKLQRLDEQPARVIYADQKRDIALLSIGNPPPTLKPLALVTENPPTGTRVYALGSPGLGRDLLDESITEGIISAVERNVDGQPFLQHTAAINPGNSGGPLLDAQGHVVGINTSKSPLENVNFAIPAPAIRKLLEKE